jgi:hypothetical protein
MLGMHDDPYHVETALAGGAPSTVVGDGQGLRLGCQARRLCRRRGQVSRLGRVRPSGGLVPRASAGNRARTPSRGLRGACEAPFCSGLETLFWGAHCLGALRDHANARRAPRSPRADEASMADHHLARVAGPCQALVLSVVGDRRGPSSPAHRAGALNQNRVLVGSARVSSLNLQLFTKCQAKSGALSLKRYPGTILNV